jgi:hypothetical protein
MLFEDRVIMNTQQHACKNNFNFHYCRQLNKYYDSNNNLVLKVFKKTKRAEGQQKTGIIHVHVHREYYCTCMILVSSYSRV